MSLAIIYTRARVAVSAPLVTVEINITNGLPALNIVGLPEKAVQESRERVRSAILNCEFEFPARRITINLAPAELPKEGGGFDLPIAIGILAASGQIQADNLSEYEFIGELALSGQIRKVSGILPVALACRKHRHKLVFPTDSQTEASLIGEIEAYPAQHLLEVCTHLNQSRPLPGLQPVITGKQNREKQPDLADVKGQHQARRALEIAAAGAHSLLMSGPPGSGKSMLAMRLPGILPSMTDDAALETAAIHSICGKKMDADTWKIPPFRAPHHSASAVALVGGGSNPQPGEISLAHNGVLFLDELTEFQQHALNVLREPLENGHITLSRAARQATYPARFQLIAAMNPCPCGYLGNNTFGPGCRCSSEQIRRYQGKISGPVMDRIDLQIEVAAIPPDILNQSATQAETSAHVRRRVLIAHECQLQRQQCNNARLSPPMIEKYCALDNSSKQLLDQAIKRIGLSARAYHRILKVARTIADLDAAEDLKASHVAEAISYRNLDRYQC